MTPSADQKAPLGQLILFLSAGILSISASAIFIRLAKAPSLSIAFWRVSFSLLLLAPLWVSPKRWETIRSLTRQQQLQLFASGICLGVHFWAWITSLALTSVAASVLLVTTNPLWVGLLSPWLVGERLSWRAWAGIAVAMTGTAIVALSADGSQQANPLLGNGLALLGAVAASGYLMFGRNVRPHLDLWSYASATLAGAWLVLVVGMLVTGTQAFGFRWIDWPLFLCMALFPQMVGHNSISWSLRYLRADVVAVLLLLEPIGSALMAWLLLQEAPEASIWQGGPLLLLGVGVVLWTQQEPKDKESVA